MRVGWNRQQHFPSDVALDYLKTTTSLPCRNNSLANNSKQSTFMNNLRWNVRRTRVYRNLLLYPCRTQAKLSEARTLPELFWNILLHGMRWGPQSRSCSFCDSGSDVGGGDASAPPKVLICWKFGQNIWKFGQNPWKSWQKWRPRLFGFKYGAQHLQ